MDLLVRYFIYFKFSEPALLWCWILTTFLSKVLSRIQVPAPITLCIFEAVRAKKLNRNMEIPPMDRGTASCEVESPRPPTDRSAEL